jgi:hypothetical protein
MQSSHFIGVQSLVLLSTIWTMVEKFIMLSGVTCAANDQIASLWNRMQLQV